ncbi:MAG: VWA domain-containing protein [Planctomycetes bacterium]|nr:VWA domain-containing protein [Planctomycetota bacterium]
MNTQPLWWLLVLIPIAFVYYTSRVNRPAKSIRLALFFRVLALFLIVLALCRPYGKEACTHVHRTYLVDLSASVTLDDVEEQLLRIEKEVEALSEDDSWSLFGFARELKVYGFVELRKLLSDWQEFGSDTHYREETCLSSAILSTRLAFPSGKNKELVILSDGSSTDGELKKSLAILSKEGVKVKFSPLDNLSIPEACVLSLSSQAKSAHHGEVLRLKTDIRSNTAMEATLKLMHQGVLEQEKKVKLSSGNTSSFYFDTIVRAHGRADYNIELVPEKDHYTGNNRVDVAVPVKGKAKIVVIHQNPSSMRAFKRALSKQGYDVHVRDENGLPGTLEELLEFDALVLANVPATAMTDRQMRDIKSYVTHFGGALVMMGSENSFGLGGYYKTPVEEVLPLVSRYEKEKETPSLAMVLVIDKSGSMNGIKVQMAKLAARSSVELLSARDQVAVLAFDGQSYEVCSLRYASDTTAIISAIDWIEASGGTNMYPSMQDAYDMLNQCSARLKHVIVLGDGQSSPGPFEQLASEMASSGMTLSTVALGSGADGALMKRMAEIGQGRFYFTMDPESVPSIFTRETMEASRSAIREEIFAPIAIKRAPFLTGIDTENLPYLLGHIMARPKATAETYFISDSGDPLFALGQFGLGQSLAFTSDMSEQWGGEWLEWSHFGKFWAQVFRAIIRKEDNSGVRMASSSHHQQMSYMLTHNDQAKRPVSDAEWEVTAVLSNGSHLKEKVNMVGLGKYEVKLPKRDGAYKVIFRDLVSGKTKSVSHLETYPAEYHLDGVKDSSLEALEPWKPKEEGEMNSIWQRYSLVPHFVVASLLSMIMGVLMRRI